MLKIRSEQIEVFESAEAPHFEPRMVRHLEEAFPKHCGFLGKAGIREVVRYGIQRSKTHGLTQQSPASLFIDLTLLLGRYFDTDPQLPWAGEILRADHPGEQLDRAQSLHAAAIDYLDRVSGPDNEYIDAAQRRLLHEPIEIKTGSAERFTTEVLGRLERIWPEKTAYLGQENAARLVKRGITAARGYDLKTEPGALVYIGLTYMLGSGFDKDPLFSRASVVLNDRTEESQSARVNRLYSAAIDYLKQWCA